MLRLWLILILTVVLFLGSCNLPVAPTPTPVDSASVLTAAANTVEALRTETAILVTPTPTTEGQSTPTQTPQGPTATNTQTSIPPTATVKPCDAAGFISDVTIPDGTRMTPGQTFTKTWRLRNIGSCTWNKNYALIFASGDAMGAPAVINLLGDVPPDSTVDVSIDMRAPNTPGKVTGNWRLRNAAGVIFGVEGNTPFYVVIEVVGTTVTPTVTPTTTGTITPSVTPTGTPTLTQTVAVGGLIYDFAANTCQADWRTAAGTLACPGIPGDINGAVAVVPSPTLETGDVATQIVLLTQPQGIENGVITGTYPALAIQSGYRFRATLGCLGGQTQCSVKYQLNYIEAGGSPQNLGQWNQTYDGSIQGVEVDLSPLAGKTVQLVLVVLADGSPAQDAALWIFPRVTKG